MNSDLSRDVILGYSDVAVIDASEMPELGLSGRDGETLKLLVWSRVEQRPGLPPKVEQLVLALDAKVQATLSEGLRGGIAVPVIQIPTLVNGGR